MEAKYIHAGFLFTMACLVIAVPFWWLVWPIRSQKRGFYSTRVRIGIRKKDWKARLRYFTIDLIHSFFYPKWSVDATHGLHAGPAVRISMILILWSFVPIVMFAQPEFGQIHAKLLISNFLLPMAVLVLGFVGDLFKGGNLTDAQHLYLQQARCKLRVWWLLAGLAYIILFLSVKYFRHGLIPLVVYMVIPVAGIFKVFWNLFNADSGHNYKNFRSRIGACQWALYALQWATVISQIWVFVWTVKPSTLEMSLSDVLFGNDYIAHFGEHVSNGDFPKGAVYFVFFILLISFFILRNSYRVKQIGRINDKAHQVAASVSVATIVIPLSYISILAFAHNIYPFIPYEKGGGDYSKGKTVSITFNTNATTTTGLPITVPTNVMIMNASNYLLMLDENSSYYFFANTNDAHGPANWRIGRDKPNIYQVCHEAITCITIGK